MGRVVVGLFIAVVASVILVAWPSMSEGTGEPCRALEKVVIVRALAEESDAAQPYRDAMRRTIANTLTRDNQLNGSAGARAANRRLGLIPTYVGCAIGYWEIHLWPATLDPWLAGMWY